MNGFDFFLSKIFYVGIDISSRLGLLQLDVLCESLG